MRVVIFGAGAVGAYVGGRLAQAGAQVALLARGDHLQALARHGLRVDSPHGDFVIQPWLATEDPTQIGVVDVVVVGVKTWQLPEVARALPALVGPVTCVVPLQNGVEASAQLAEVVGAQAVLGGCCRIMSARVAPAIFNTEAASTQRSWWEKSITGAVRASKRSVRPCARRV